MVIGAVDAALRYAVALLGNGQRPQPLPFEITAAATGESSWRGIASDQATAAAAQLSSGVQQLQGAHRSAAAAIGHATALVADARHQLAAVQSEWERDKAALSVLADTPAGHSALLAAGTLRIEEIGSLVTNTASQLATLAQEVSALTTQLPTTPDRPDDGIQLVDHTVVQAPPPNPDTPPTGAEIAEVLQQLPVGNRPHIREVRTAQDLENLWEWAIQGGTEIPEGYGLPGKGTRFRLPDGTAVGQRPVAESNNLPALDFTIPGHEYTKVHINPRGGIPEVPTAATLPGPTWGTYVSPEELINNDNPALRILGQMLLDQLSLNSPRGHA